MHRPDRNSRSISILIPTLNRSDFLIRALNYYNKVGFKGYICIGDSSNDEHTGKIKRAIQTLEGKLRIIYRHFPNPPYLHDGMVMKELIDLAHTRYAVTAGDDDFNIPSGLEQCITFLENNPKYSAAHGVRVKIHLKSGGVFGELDTAWYNPQPILEFETASERWVKYMKCAYSIQYSVHRVEAWRKMYRDVASVPLRHFGPDLLPNSISAILGKVKQLDCLSTVFQPNDNPHSPIDRLGIYPLITHPDWPRSLQVIRNSIIEAIVEQDGIDEGKAKEVFDRELELNIFRHMQSHYYTMYGTLTNAPNFKNSIKKVLKHIPGLVYLYRRLRQTAGFLRPDPDYENLISLDWLLRPSCPFYSDFGVVHNVIVDGRSVS